MFKQTIHPAFPDGSLALMGFARPAFGSIPPCSEMQSRLHAMVASGEKQLPCEEELRALAKKDQDNWDYRFGWGRQKRPRQLGLPSVG